MRKFAYPLTRTPEPGTGTTPELVRVTYHRGFEVVHCTVADWRTEWAHRVVTHFPVAEFELTDAPVWESKHLKGWTCGAASLGDVALPAELFEAATDPDTGWPYPAEAAARTVLRRAAARLARERVK